ncbi:DNA-processing protein DprA [Ahrensia sp. R2A130]|uniref:DNA-processing protein DprA n=1 Tax=Ahrensia sp. R2A130 TaxID=744979 RepID=UPI0001E0D0A8|nr:DNA-processing protein DprA [Ahrensia sp. R2A130]EFL90295.1 DNA protecting protein DprA [Ahrensia sp. R2A130]
MSDALAPTAGIRLADEQKLAWLRLIRTPRVGPATFIDLIRRFGTASEALNALPDLAAKAGAKAIKVADADIAKREMDALTRGGGDFVCLGEPDYPPALRFGDRPPPVLAIRGDRTALGRDAVAIVGSRNASVAGLKLTAQFARDIGSSDYLIVSGLARGVDSAAHKASIETGTVAVFAGGVDHLYPPENGPLLDAILATGGAAISEMPLGFKPRAQDFPRRNRIVAGMAMGLVVVEAAKRSGSLISARLANEMGRQVFAVPGSPLDPRSEGTNHLIRQGAELARNGADVVAALQPLTDAQGQLSYSLNDSDYETDGYEDNLNQSDREKLQRSLSHAPVDIDDLIRHTDLPAGAVQMLLLEMDLAGTIERHSGNRVSLA